MKTSMKPSAFALAICLSMLPGCATPATTDEAPLAAVEGQMASDGTKVVCRNITITGSRFPKKDCRSQGAWDAFDTQMADNARSETDKIQRLKTGCSTTGTC